MSGPTSTPRDATDPAVPSPDADDSPVARPDAGTSPDANDRLAVTDRSRLRRRRERGHHDRATVEAILDEGLVAHVGVLADGVPLVLPMAYARIDDHLYLHGATANRLLAAAAENPICATVTLLDGLVLARSAFHHSMNYRSVALFGVAEKVTEPDEKQRSFDALVDHVVPGRSKDARPPTPGEARATMVLRLPIDEGSAKVRAGGPVDEPEDLSWPAWAGSIPLTLTAGAPQADSHTPDTLSAPTPRPWNAGVTTRDHQ